MSTAQNYMISSGGHHTIYLMMQQIVNFRRIENTSLNRLHQPLSHLFNHPHIPCKTRQRIEIESATKRSCRSKNSYHSAFECNAAGLMAGSIPTKGTSNFSRNEPTAAAVAVLHATTIISAPLSMR